MTEQTDNKRDKTYKYLLPVGHFLADLNAGCLSGILPFLISAYHYDYATATILVMISNMIGSLAQLIFGGLADRKNQPLILPIGILLSAGGMAIVGVLDNFIGMCIAVTVSGVGIAMFHPQAMKILNAFTTEREMGGDVSLFSLGGCLGVTLGPLVITAFVQLLGMKGCLLLFVFPAIFIALNLTVGRSLLETKKPSRTRTEAGETPEGAVSLVQQPQGQDRWAAFLILTVVVFGRSAAAGVLNTYMSLYWIDVLGQSDAAGNTALSVFSALIALFTFLGGGLADRYGYKRMILLSFVILIPAIFAMALNTQIWIAALLMLPVSLGISLSYSPLIVLGQIYLPNHIGFASGVTMGLATSVGSILAPILGKVADGSGLGNSFLILGFISCIPLAASFFLAPKK